MKESTESMQNHHGLRNMREGMFYLIWTISWAFVGMGFGTRAAVISNGWKASLPWLVPMVVAMSFMFAWVIFPMIREGLSDLRKGEVKLTGELIGRYVTRGTPSSISLSDFLVYSLIRSHWIVVDNETFIVTSKIYNRLQLGQQICAHYWPDTRIVTRIDRFA